MDTSTSPFPYLPKHIVDKILKDHLSDTTNFAQLSRIRMISKEMNNHASKIILNRDLKYFTECSTYKFLLSFGHLSFAALNRLENKNIRFQFYTLVNFEIIELSELIDINLLKDIVMKFKNNGRKKSKQTLSVLKSKFDICTLHRLCTLLAICTMFDPTLFEPENDFVSDNESDYDDYIEYVFEVNNGLFDWDIYNEIKEDKREKYYADNSPLFNIHNPLLICIFELKCEKYKAFEKTVNILDNLEYFKSIESIIDIISSLPLLDIVLMTEFRLRNVQ